MSDWKTADTAPKDRHILLFGKIDPQYPFEQLRWDKESVFSGYWDTLDEAWCPSGATWIGPFMEITHWTELPDGPTA